MYVFFLREIWLFLVQIRILYVGITVYPLYCCYLNAFKWAKVVCALFLLRLNDSSKVALTFTRCVQGEDMLICACL